jgi:carbamate kinase
MIEVDPEDPAFHNPTKPIGPFYDRATAEGLERERGWTFRPDGDAYRRVVPSPKPLRIFEMRQIRWLLEHACVVICAGGGGIPTMYRAGRQLVGVEAVIDKDHASGLLARDVGADIFVMATDADAVYLDFRKPGQRAIARAHPDALMEYASQFPEGSMLPKVVAACEFARASGKKAAIGALKDIEGMLAGTAGTIVSIEEKDLDFHAA